VTYSESVEDIAASIKSKLLRWVAVDCDPADLHVSRSDHFELVVPSTQHSNQFTKPGVVFTGISYGQVVRPSVRLSVTRWH